MCRPREQCKNSFPNFLARAIRRSDRLWWPPGGVTGSGVSDLGTFKTAVEDFDELFHLRQGEVATPLKDLRAPLLRNIMTGAKWESITQKKSCSHSKTSSPGRWMSAALSNALTVAQPLPGSYAGESFIVVRRIRCAAEELHMAFTKSALPGKGFLRKAVEIHLICKL